MGNIHILLAVTMLSWFREAQEGGYNLSVYPTMNVVPVDNARNEIVREFLKSDCTHLFFVDSDTIPPVNAIKKLLAADKPIVSALTPIVEHDEARKNDSNGFYRKLNAVGEHGKHLNEYVGLVPIIGAGGSCILIRREVFEKMQYPWYRFQYQDDNGKETIVGEDIYFTAMAKSAGFQPWAETSVICKHNKPILW